MPRPGTGREVHLFEGSGASWTPLQVFDGTLHGPRCHVGPRGDMYGPRGLRFTSDGSGLVVADTGNARVTLFRVEDGAFVREVATGLDNLADVEECEGGWLVACAGSVEHVGGGGVVASLGHWSHDEAPGRALEDLVLPGGPGPLAPGAGAGSGPGCAGCGRLWSARRASWSASACRPTHDCHGLHVTGPRGVAGGRRTGDSRLRPQVHVAG
jgi:hypothetical protein